MKDKQLRIVAPVGAVPKVDKELRKRMATLPHNTPISTVFKEIDRWEKVTIVKFREYERTTKSGKLDEHCW